MLPAFRNICRTNIGIARSCRSVSNESLVRRNNLLHVGHILHPDIHVVLRQSSVYSPPPSTFVKLRHQRNYSTTQFLHLGDKNNLSDKYSSASYFDKVQTQANKWFNQMTNQVMESSNAAATDAASKTLRKTQQMTQDAAAQAAKSFSETLLAGRKNFDQAMQQTSSQLQESASSLTQTTKETAKEQGTKLTRASSEIITKASQTVRQVVQDSAKATKQATRQVVEERVHRPLKATSESISQKSQELVVNVTSTGTKLLRWAFWWTLAAVFVYGVASTLPMALIKYTLERRNEKIDQEAEDQSSSRKKQEAYLDSTKSASASSGRWTWSS
jgi:hypothetical protein